MVFESRNPQEECLAATLGSIPARRNLLASTHLQEESSNSRKPLYVNAETVLGQDYTSFRWLCNAVKLGHVLEWSVRLLVGVKC